MIVENWSQVRSLMRSRRAVQVIHEERGVRIQTVRRSGQPQTLSVPCAAGPVPVNMRDVLYEADRAVTAAPARLDVDLNEVFGE